MPARKITFVEFSLRVAVCVAIYVCFVMSASAVDTSRVDDTEENVTNKLQKLLSKLPPIPDSVACARDSILEHELQTSCIASLDNYDAPPQHYIDRVRRIGKRVLDRWPLSIQTSGINFRVVHSAIPSALACPQGTIAVTDSMLDCLDSNDQVEALLAHEIAHAELHHSLLAHKRGRTVERGFESFLKTLERGLKKGDTTKFKFPQAMKKPLGLVGETVGDFMWCGHSVVDEREADLLMLYYCWQAHGSCSSAVNLLRALAEIEPPSDTTPNMLSTHPRTQDRIETSESVAFRLIPSPACVLVLNTKRDTVLLIRFQVQGTYSYNAIRSDTATAINERTGRSYHYYPKHYEQVKEQVVIATADRPRGVEFAKFDTLVVASSAGEVRLSCKFMGDRYHGGRQVILLRPVNNVQVDWHTLSEVRIPKDSLVAYWQLCKDM